MESQIFKLSFGISLVISGLGFGLNCRELTRLNITKIPKSLLLLLILNFSMITQSLFAEIKGRTVCHEVLGVIFITGLALYPFVRCFHVLSSKLKWIGAIVNLLTFISICIVGAADYGVLSPIIGFAGIVIGFVTSTALAIYLLVILEPIEDSKIPINSQSFAQSGIVCAMIVFVVSVLTAGIPALHFLIDVPEVFLSICGLLFSISEYFKLSDESDLEESDTEQLLK